ADRPDLGRDAVAAAVAGWWADALEQAVVDAGGVAAAQRAEGAWWHTDAGAAVRAEPLVALTTRAAAGRPLGRLAAEALPLTGVRVLDLTRVLAGPVCTGFLAAWGADVLRIDPPDFDEVPAVVPVTTAGKRTARLDLASAAGREQLLALVAEADIVVHGYRSDALAKLGAGPERWCEVRPDLVEVALDAYGWTGPWRHRRGFDSLVQHTSGITAIGQAAAGAERPVPMPCQALDHGCGWLLGASAVAGLARRARTGAGTSARVSLARLASWLVDQPCSGDPQRPAPTLDDLGPYLTVAPTAWGPLRRLAWPGRLGDLLPAMGRSVPIGAGAARW
ncbi:MAG: CoA transferase, partial [Acidimicrobiia bacterium]|nr:CoA transferase [Acidimicrobiia bacterium]